MRLDIAIFAIIAAFFAGRFHERLVDYIMSKRRPPTMPTFMIDGPSAIIVTQPIGQTGSDYPMVVGMVYQKDLLDRLGVENLECNGQEFDPKLYPDLKLILRDAFGENRVPDLRARTLRARYE